MDDAGVAHAVVQAALFGVPGHHEQADQTRHRTDDKGKVASARLAVTDGGAIRVDDAEFEGHFAGGRPVFAHKERVIRDHQDDADSVLLARNAGIFGSMGLAVPPAAKRMAMDKGTRTISMRMKSMI